MNFLAHLLVSADNPDLLTGNLMGDFVKGRLEGRFPPGITAGIRMHRQIDSFAGSNELFRASRLRIDPAFGHYRGVLVDLFYDHFLAVTWDDYSSVPLPVFLKKAHATVCEYREFLPKRLDSLLPIIFNDLLPSYAELSGIDHALGRMSLRVERPNPLADGGGELRRHYSELGEDFARFYPELVRYCREL